MKTTLQDIQNVINEQRKNLVVVDGKEEVKLYENWHLFITNNPQSVLSKIKSNMKASFSMEGVKNVEDIIAELEKEDNVKVQQAKSNDISEANLHMVVEVYFLNEKR